MGPGVSFSFEFAKKPGAALITKCRTFQADVDLEAAFEEYTKRHYNSWVAFAREKKCGNDIKPVLVTGVDMTRDFAMMTYSGDGTCLSSKFTVSAPIPTSTSGSAWGKWETSGIVHTNWGPQLCPLPPLTELENSSTNVTEIPQQFNQCVFVRYYTMRWKAFMFPKVIKAAAGPHDLGRGNDREEELMAQLSLDSETRFEGGEDSSMYYFSSGTSHGPVLEPHHNVRSVCRPRNDFPVLTFV